MTDKPSTYSATAEVAYKRIRRTRWQRIKLSLSKAPPTAWFGMIVIFLYIICAVFAPFLAPYGEAEVFPEPFAPMEFRIYFWNRSNRPRYSISYDLWCKKHCKYCCCYDRFSFFNWWYFGSCSGNKPKLVRPIFK